MKVRTAELTDKKVVLDLLDEFRADCMEQITGTPSESTTAITKGAEIYEALLSRPDYCIQLLVDDNSEVVGIITGFLCPMLRTGTMRAEIEEFFVKKNSRGNGNASRLMDAFFEWCKKNNVQKINLESDNDLFRAHRFYEKYGFETTAKRFSKIGRI